MSSSETTGSRSVDVSAASSALWLAATAFLALLAIYFVGVDQETPVHQFNLGQSATREEEISTRRKHRTRQPPNTTTTERGRIMPMPT